MPKVSIPVPNLLGGVSQQAREVRLPTQCEEMVNASTTPVRGLSKRAATSHVAKLITSASEAPSKIHFIDRDSSERYVVSLEDHFLRVFDLAGTAYPVVDVDNTVVNAPGDSDLAYLNIAGAPRDAFRALTLADYTIIVNTEKTVAMSGSTNPNPTTTEFYIDVRESNYSTLYEVFVKLAGGTEKAFRVFTHAGEGDKPSSGIYLLILATGSSGAWTVHTVSGNLGGDATYTITGSESEIEVAKQLAWKANNLTDVGAVSYGQGVPIYHNAAWAPTVTSVPTAGQYARIEILRSIRSEDIAEALRVAIDADSDLVCTRKGSVLRVTASVATDYVRTSDSNSGSGLFVVNRQTDKFDKLPTTCYTGYVVNVQESTSNAVDDWYVVFETFGTDTFGEGYWTECPAPGSQIGLDASTMPHTLTRRANTATNTPVNGLANGAVYFQFAPVTWGIRQAGDQTTAPRPSFVGQKLRDVFFFRNRLGLLAATNVVLSEEAQYFNFFRTTVQQLVDSDPIDLAASDVQVPLLQHAVPFGERCVVFSDRSQFVLDGDPLLTPKAAQLKKKSAFAADPSFRPVLVGRTPFFAFTSGGYARLYQMFEVPSSDSQLDAQDVTEQVPRYIAGSARELAHSEKENFIAIQGSTDLDTLAVYRFLWNGQEKVLSSWGQYTFSADIRGLTVIDSTLWLVMDRADGIFLESMDISADPQDPNVTWQAALDRRVSNTACTVTYNAGTGKTTITLPYAIESGATMQVVTRDNGSESAGAVLGVYSQGSNTVVVNGDHSTTPFWVGEQYTMRYRFSTPLARVPTRSGAGLLPTARWTIDRLYLTYSKTAYFSVKLNTTARPLVQIPFTPGAYGVWPTTYGALPVKSGVAQIALFALGEEADVTIESGSPLPVNLISAEWEGHITARSTRYGG